MRQQFISAINQHQSAFGIGLPAEKIERLADYYDLVIEHNPLLHLVGPCSPEEFAIRHILESLMLLDHLPHGAKFADVGAGAGLPSIPCLIVRGDLKAVMVESKQKKTGFLGVAVERLGISGRAEIMNKQFQEVDPADCQAVTCRALDKFIQNLGRLLKWSKRRRLLLFGGPNLGEALEAQNVIFTKKLMPMSERRFLFLSGQ